MAEQSAGDNARRAGDVHDFSEAIRAGLGMTRLSDPRLNDFYKCLATGEFQKTGLREVSENLRNNIRRMEAYSRFALTMFNYGRRFEEFVKAVCERENIDLKGRAFPDVGEDFPKIKDALRRWIFGDEEYPSLIGNVTYSDDVAGAAAFFSNEENEQEREAFRGGHVIQAWTVFESLSEDLWIAAVNFHPSRLASLSGTTTSKYFAKRHSQAEQKQGKGQDKSIQVYFNDLEKCDFSLKNKLGTMLSERGRVTFKAIDAIRSAYYQAFSKRNGDVLTVLEDEGLQYAAAVRNLLIHKGGRVDEEFVRQTKLVSGVPQLVEGQEFKLNGQLAAQLTDSCRCCATWLVVAVHQWILNSPASSEDSEEDSRDE